jgi:hypothetical protein
MACHCKCGFHFGQTLVSLSRCTGISGCNHTKSTPSSNYEQDPPSASDRHLLDLLIFLGLPRSPTDLAWSARSIARRNACSRIANRQNANTTDRDGC